MASLERNNKILLDLVRQPGNNLCADCGAPGEYPDKAKLPQYIHFEMILNLSDWFTTTHVLSKTAVPDVCENEHVFFINV